MTNPCVVVIDGEHYPPVIASALAEIPEREPGTHVACAVLVGGKEKLDGDLDRIGDVPVMSGGDGRALLAEAIERFEVDHVIDLSDEPVLDYQRRHELASVALYLDAVYEGADFLFTPPHRPFLCTKPSMAIIGTGKRTGKTAVAGFGARLLKEEGHRPCIVAMGRGGPPEPEVLHGDRVALEPRDLLALAESGKHAASDYVEDALLGRVPTVGCRRCGGGLAGGVEFSNVAAGVELANDLEGDMIILEGSGSALPPVQADAHTLIVPASIPHGYIDGYFGPYRLLLSDLVVITMCEEPFGSPSDVSSLSTHIRKAFRWGRRGRDESEELRVVRTVFRPQPTRSVEGATVFVATTAPETAGRSIKTHLEDHHGCKVVGISHSLSDRPKLKKEIEEIGRNADTLLCEIKAAGIDVATKKALEEGLEVVYMDNVPHGVDGDDPVEAFRWVGELAVRRFEEAHS